MCKRNYIWIFLLQDLGIYIKIPFKIINKQHTFQCESYNILLKKFDIEIYTDKVYNGWVLTEHKKKLAKERNRRAYIKRKLKKIQEQTSNEVIPYQEEYKDYETSNEVIPYQEEYKDYETITEIVPYEKIDILNGAGTEIIKTNGPLRITPNIYRKKD